jgi:ElaB/YqjD/DUF883 family membrane-anchored ribosome-binding protein
MSNNSYSDASSSSREKLVEDFKVLSKDVQDLLKVTASVMGDRAAEARVRVQDSLKVAQDKLSDVHENVKAKGQEAFTKTDGYVRDNPWNAVGIAAGVGFLIGICFSASAIFGRSDD